MRSLVPLFALGLITLLLAGCDSAPAKPASATAAVAPPGPPAPPAPPAAPSPTIGVLAPTDDPAAEASATEAPATVESGTEIIEAGVGVGIKGRSLDEHEGIYVTPAKTLFTAKEKIIFEIAVPNAIQLYAALEGDGNGPKTHEEFMEKVIKANKIELPMLPPGHKYLYDPEKQQLMVERPRKIPAGN